MNKLLKATLSFLFVVAVCFTGCNKPDEPNNGGNNGNNGGDGGDTPETPAIVSSSEVQYDGKVFVEAVFEDETKMYFAIISPTEMAVTSGEFFYQDNPSQAYTYRGDVVIPKMITHLGTTYTVVEIGWKAFYDCSLVSSVIIPNTVTKISSYYRYPNYYPNSCSNTFGAFQDCTNLERIQMSTNIQVIGDLAFSGCPCFGETVNIPKYVKSIGKAAFDSKNVLFNADSCFVAGDLESSNSSDNVYVSAFPNMNTISFGDNVKVMPSYLYLGMNPTTIDLPSSVTIIAFEAFRGCSNLEKVNNSQNIRTIETQAFCSCRSLNFIILGDELTRIGDGAFKFCGSLSSIVFPNSLNKIENSAFVGCGIRTIVWGNSIDTIGQSAFRSCHHLTSVDIPNTVTTIEGEAFELCDSISSLIIGNAVTSIGSSAFRGCHELVSVSLGNSVTTIGARSFRDCRKLTEIVLPSSIRNINDNAFDECYEASNITCFAVNPPVLGEEVFGRRFIQAIRVPMTSVEAYKAADGWNRYADVIVGI